MGSSAKSDVPFDVITPVGTGIVTDRPLFEWQALVGAERYTVAIFDERAKVIAQSPTIGQTNWTPADPLPRDRTYVWQVTAFRGRDTMTIPVAPAAPARFHVVDARSAEVLQRLETEHPESHLVLGILNMDAGIRDAATRHLQQVPSSDPHVDVAQRSLEQLRALSPSAPAR